MMKLLQKAQLKQHKIFQNFLTNPTPTAPNAPPLPTGTTPKVSPLLEPNNSDNDSPETPFDTKTGNTFLDNNKSLTQTHICKKLTFTHSPLRQRLSKLLALQSQVCEANDLFAFPLLKNVNAQRQLIPQYEDIDFSHIQ